MQAGQCFRLPSHVISQAGQNRIADAAAMQWQRAIAHQATPPGRDRSVRQTSYQLGPAVQKKRRILCLAQVYEHSNRESRRGPSTCITHASMHSPSYVIFITPLLTVALHDTKQSKRYHFAQPKSETVSSNSCAELQ